uniref:Uncharacterized protein n=1 Tax=Anas platyrhynchos platyrhynchos TaxID=8840 RepID=A0A493TRT5_ANAPP
MGKSNSKLKPEVVEELTRKTYCEYTGEGVGGSAVPRGAAGARGAAAPRSPPGPPQVPPQPLGSLRSLVARTELPGHRGPAP